MTLTQIAHYEKSNITAHIALFVVINPPQNFNDVMMKTLTEADLNRFNIYFCKIILPYFELTQSDIVLSGEFISQAIKDINPNLVIALGNNADAVLRMKEIEHQKVWHPGYFEKYPTYYLPFINHLKNLGHFI